MVSCWKHWCILLLLLAGCMTTETSAILPDSLAPIERLPMEVDEYASLAWLDHDHIITSYRYSNVDNFSAHHLGVLALTQSQVQPLLLPAHERCKDLIYSTFLPVTLPDQRLAYMTRCVESPAEGFREYMMVYDPILHTTTALRADRIAPRTVRGSTGRVSTYSFFPDMQTGILVDSWTGATQLHTFDATSVTRVDLGVDTVGAAALSPDGTNLLITTQQGHKGIEMLGEPYQIELVDPSTWERRPLFEAYYAGSITWSPDSQHVAIRASEDTGLHDQVWIINATTGARRRVASDHIGKIAWSPDGTTIAAMRYVKPEAVMNTQTELVLLDLTQVELP